MLVIIGEISDPLDKTAIDGQLLGLDMAKSIVDRDVNFNSGKDVIALYLEFNKTSEGSVFWGWLMGHGAAGGGEVTRHICNPNGPCTVSHQKEF